MIKAVLAVSGVLYLINRETALFAELQNLVLDQPDFDDWKNTLPQNNALNDWLDVTSAIVDEPVVFGGILSDVVSDLPPIIKQPVTAVTSVIKEVVVPAVAPITQAVAPTLTGGWNPPAKAKQYLDAVYQAERKNGIPHQLLASLIHQESRWDPNAKSSVGAMGLGQFMPDTAKDFKLTNPYEPFANIEASGKYLRWCYDYVAKRLRPSWKLALAGYNGGVGNVVKYGGIPPFEETRNYVKKITALVPVS